MIIGNHNWGDSDNNWGMIMDSDNHDRIVIFYVTIIIVMINNDNHDNNSDDIS